MSEKSSTVSIILDFLNSPAGVALIQAVPELVTQLIQTLTKKGVLTPEAIAAHFAIQIPEIAEQPK